MPKTERRDCERYVFELPVHAAWKNAAGEIKEETGITKDISSAGVFMVCKNLIDEDCEINIRIDLPSLAEDAAKSRVSARSRVVRKVGLTNPGAGYHGYGIAFNNYKILRIGAGSRERRTGSGELRAGSGRKEGKKERRKEGKKVRR